MVSPGDKPPPEPTSIPERAAGQVGFLTRRPRAFVSLRWRAVWPVLALAVVLAMLTAYVVSRELARQSQEAVVEQLLRSSQHVSERVAALAAFQQRELDRIRSQPEVRAAMQAGDGPALHALLEPLARAAGLDYVLLANPAGQEIVGLRRVALGGDRIDYAVATGSDLSALLPRQEGVGGPDTTAQATLARAGEGYALFSVAPVLAEGSSVGTVYVGTEVRRVLDLLCGSDPVDLVLFGQGGRTLADTLDAATGGEALLALHAWLEDIGDAPERVSVRAVTLAGEPYHASFVPLTLYGVPLGVMVTLMPDEAVGGSGADADRVALAVAGAVGLLTVLALVVAGRVAVRLERVTRTVNALAAGQGAVRTRMQAHDEIGELGAAVDRLAERYQRRAEKLQRALRQQRAEAARLYAVLEAMPDGLVVQDLEGRVLLLNDRARQLLGGQRTFRAARLHELADGVSEHLGPALAPGIYALGDPTRVSLEGRVLQAQAAALTVGDGRRIGTVIVLRDMTAEVAKEQARDALLERLEREAEPPAEDDTLAMLAQEVIQNTRAIQRVIAELRDLSTFEPRDLRAGQRPLPLNELVRSIALEWEPFARVARMRLRVHFAPDDPYVLGDERRLRWAIGNVLDNALKYSPPDSPVYLRARTPAGDPAMAEIEVADHGYGMSPDDVAEAFTRFYRGTPRDAHGAVVRKPGTGQGLFIARRVIEAHGGTISLQSREGAGTTVVVRLPLTSPVTLPLSGVSQEGSLSSGGGYDTVPLEVAPPSHCRRRS